MPAKEEILMIHRYLSGQMTAAERATFERRLEAEPALASLHAELSLVWNASTQYSTPSFAHGAALHTFQGQLAAYKRRRRRYVLAGLICGVLALSLTVFVLLKNNHGAEMKDIQAPVAATERLADGTLAHLRAGAHLRIPAHFGAKRRVEIVQGDVIFEVAKDEKRPFLIKNTMGSVEVTGTVFLLSVDTLARVFTVAVTEGSVRFTPALSSSPIALSAGKGIRYDAVSRIAEPMQTLDHNLLSWYSRELVFDDAPLREVVRDLQAHYGIQVMISDTALLNCRFTAPLAYRDVPVEVIIDALSIAFGMTAKHDMPSDAYTLAGGTCR